MINKAATPARSARVYTLEDHSQAAKRLDFLKNALGDKLDPELVVAARLPANEMETPTPVAAPRRQHSTQSLLVWCLLSAVIGAGLAMWSLAAPSQTASQQQIQQASPQSATTPAAPQPVSPPSPPQQAEERPTDIVAESEVRAAVERWRQAWSRRDVAAYLGSYSQNFVPADGQPPGKWAEARRHNLLARNDITVRISQIDATQLDKDSYRLVFLQDYRSGSVKEIAQPKTLLVVREGSEWRIAGEWQGIQDVPAR